MTESLRVFLDAYHNGTASNAYDFLGCHKQTRDGVDGFVFRLWAPGAQGVYVIGDFNDRDPEPLRMERIFQGIWEGWTSAAREGDAYKYCIQSWNGKIVFKTDPFAFRTCRAPSNAGIVCDHFSYEWHDDAWLARNNQSFLNRPLNIYEVHLGSWRRKEDGSLYTYSELAPILAEYVRSMGYTHVQLMPVCESPDEPNLDYQAVGYFAPTSRYGAPEELMELVDTLHRAGIGVILDWMIGHFSADDCGLAEFDGTCVYESADPETNHHTQRNTRFFDFEKPEVRSFLISGAMYWLDVFHMDGLRVDGVDDILFLDQHREVFRPNPYGGRENLAAMDFLRQLNRVCFLAHPGAILCACTEMDSVTVPNFSGGLGFLFNWNPSWCDHMLTALRNGDASQEENFIGNQVLTVSHNAVCSGQGSLMVKLPGEPDRKFARARLLRGLQMTVPGKKLLFMGSEFGQFIQWDPRHSLDWMLLDFESHRRLHAYQRTLNRFYLDHPALWQDDFRESGCRWLCRGNTLAFTRSDQEGRILLVVCNLTQEPRACTLPLPAGGTFVPVFSSEDVKFGGSGCSAESFGGSWEEGKTIALAPLSLTVYAHRADI